MRVREIAGQHRDLKLELDRIHLILLAPSDALPKTRMLALLRHEAGKLAVSLEHHFGYEETGGYMSEVLEERPGLNRRVEALQRQHEALLRRLEGVGHHDLTLGDVRGELAEVLDVIGEHERDEVAIYQETFATDLGEGD